MILRKYTVIVMLPTGQTRPVWIAHVRASHEDAALREGVEHAVKYMLTPAPREQMTPVAALPGHHDPYWGARP